MWLFAVFLIVPMIEIALFIQVGGWLTLWPTLGIVVATAIVGTMLLRWQGTQVLRELQNEMQSLGNPISPLAHGALVLVGGVMMILPGFFTDIIGILLMFPPVRRLVISLLLSRVSASGKANFTFGSRASSNPNYRNDGAIDAEYSEVLAKDAQKPPLSGWTKD
jgi:UPF0716 protein FxsA